MPFNEPKIQYTHTQMFNFLYIIISEDLNLSKVHYFLYMCTNHFTKLLFTYLLLFLYNLAVHSNSPAVDISLQFLFFLVTKWIEN